ncbi:MAG: 50S ribosomal protein L3 [Actinobacteria bacterium]|nr:50S ribosomal protein L3 [Actinomycetota bacterium]
MLPALLGKKIGMTQVYDQAGVITPVTVIEAGPCTVLQVKTAASDGYWAVQMGMDPAKTPGVHKRKRRDGSEGLARGYVRRRGATLSAVGHAAKVGASPMKFVREVRTVAEPEVNPGDVLTVESFGETQRVDIIGLTKGKGFAGVMKRHGFKGLCASHGTERKHRSAGGIGGSANSATGRSVKKGKRMAGHMGHVRITSKNHRLVKIDTQNNVLLVSGSIPGPNGAYILIERAKTA